jgi:LPXTG-site transpeptidase (sortase) family protein
MRNPHAPRLIGFVVCGIFLAVVVLAFGRGNLPVPGFENGGAASGSGRVAVADEVAGGNPFTALVTLSPTLSISSSGFQTPAPRDTPTFFPAGTLGKPFTSTDILSPPPVPTLPGEYAPDVVLVKIDPAQAGSTFKDCLQSANASIRGQIKEIGVLQLVVPKGEVSKALSSLSDCPGVSFAEPDYIVTVADTIPHDPGWVHQYGLVAIRAPQGWDLNTGSTGVTIAVVDTGVDLSHLDLVGKLVPGYNILNNAAPPMDDSSDSHGTHVAGIAAAMTNNDIGVAGVSWGARIMPVKVIGASGSGSIDNVALGVIWAADNGANVINLSLGCGQGSCPTPPLTLAAAVNYAFDKGVTLVAAVGNGGSNFVYYPARFPHVIAVAATNTSNKHSPYSSTGAEVDVSAPGDTIYSTIGNDAYGYLTGTSMSTAFVSGLAAILRGLPEYSSPDQIASAMESSALDLGTPGWDSQFGYGLIQMDAAIHAFQATPTPTFTPTSTPTVTPTPTPTVNPVAEALALPATGFIPHQLTSLPVQPSAKSYADLGNLWLEIPSLQVELPIVGVPLVDNLWDVSWLGDQAGWLNGTAFPTHAGNSVISAHVFDAAGNPGPFIHLDRLVWGDQVIVHAFGQEYIYSVRDSLLVAPGSVSSVIRHEQYPWLTLITCQDYDAASNSYRFRVVVRAVQVEIK